jgi:hypothetical protein
MDVPRGSKRLTYQHINRLEALDVLVLFDRSVNSLYGGEHGLHNFRKGRRFDSVG